MRWSKLRKRLATEFLVPTLQGRIRWQMTDLNQPLRGDAYGRWELYLDGMLIYRGVNVGEEEGYFPAAVDMGFVVTGAVFDAFHVFITQRYSVSLGLETVGTTSELVKIIAVLDGRLTKKQLVQLQQSPERHSLLMQYLMRLRAEDLLGMPFDKAVGLNLETGRAQIDWRLHFDDFQANDRKRLSR